MASAEGICNRALIAFGSTADQIQTLTEDSEAAKLCSLMYEDERDQLLREWDWNFAKRLKALGSLNLQAGESRWMYVYAYPADCVFARDIQQGPSGIVGDFTFEVGHDGSQRVIYSNVPQAHLWYTVQIKNPNDMTSEFRNTLSWRLAWQLALAITDSREIRQETLNVYQSRLGEAKALDGNEGTPTPRPVSSYESAR